MRYNLLEPNLVLYLPLYELEGGSFMSRDAYGHLCTVFGARWSLHGINFDGVDDRLNLGHAPAFTFTSENYTIIAWMKLGAWNGGHLFCKGATSDGGHRLNFDTNFRVYYYTHQVGTNQQSVSSAYPVSLNEWFFFSLVRIGTAVDLRFNLVSKITDVGVHQDPTPTTKNLYIGCYDHLGAVLNGIIGMMAFYNRPVPFTELQNIYIGTKTALAFC